MDYKQPSWETVVNWQLVDHEDRIARLEKLVAQLTIRVAAVEQVLRAAQASQAVQPRRRRRVTGRA